MLCNYIVKELYIYILFQKTKLKIKNNINNDILLILILSSILNNNDISLENKIKNGFFFKSNIKNHKKEGIE